MRTKKAELPLLSDIDDFLFKGKSSVIYKIQQQLATQNFSCGDVANKYNPKIVHTPVTRKYAAK